MRKLVSVLASVDTSCLSGWALVDVNCRWEMWFRIEIIDADAA